jgi:hypothetical protein
MKLITFSSKQKKEIIKRMTNDIQNAKNVKDIEDYKLRLFSNLDKIIAPTILYSPKAWLKMCELIEDCTVEIQWHGVVSRNEETNTFYVEDILVFHQIVSGAGCDVDEEEYAKFLMALMMDPNFDYNKLRYHGHSHVNMQVYSSGVDDKYQSDMLPNIQDYYIFAIGNKKGALVHFVYDTKNNRIFEPNDVQQGLSYDGVTLDKTWGKDMVAKYTKSPTPIVKSYSAAYPTNPLLPGTATAEADPFEFVGFPKEQIDGQIDWRSIYGLE